MRAIDVNLIFAVRIIFWTSRFALIQNFSTVEHFLCNLWYFLMSFEDNRNNGLLKRKFQIFCGCRKILCSSYSISFVLDIFQFCCESHYEFSSARKYFCAKVLHWKDAWSRIWFRSFWVNSDEWIFTPWLHRWVHQSL